MNIKSLLFTLAAVSSLLLSEIQAFDAFGGHKSFQECQKDLVVAMQFNDLERIKSALEIFPVTQESLDYLEAVSKGIDSARDEALDKAEERDKSGYKKIAKGFSYGVGAGVVAKQVACAFNQGELVGYASGCFYILVASLLANRACSIFGKDLGKMIQIRNIRKNGYSIKSLVDEKINKICKALQATLYNNPEDIKSSINYEVFKNVLASQAPALEVPQAPSVEQAPVQVQD